MTPQTRALIEALEKAEQLASIASDWNLDEVEIDGVMTRTVELEKYFRAAISSAKAAEEGVESAATKKAPQHAFEVSIRIGANEAGYVARTLQEITETIDRSGVAGGCSGGWDGSWSIDVRKRDVLPDDYRNELEQWRESISVREKEGL